nr:probable ribonuclease ZC3H12D [Maniola hyperantus]
MSGDSDVTVVNIGRRKDRVNSTQMKNFLNAITKMDSSQKGTLLDLMAQRIFNGCNGPSTKNSLHSLKIGATRAPESVEDTYIKQVILGRQASRNSIGSNIYNPERDIRNKTGLRMVVIDGSNVAMQHSRGRVFSVKGLKICIDYFVQRGHVVRAFVPQFRCKAGKSTDGKLLSQLERQGLVVFTPSREIQGRLINSYDDRSVTTFILYSVLRETRVFTPLREIQGRLITSYDDRYIVQCAAEFDSVIVSGDNYRDLLLENPRWRHVIENRLLQFTWVGDMIMFPRDPLGRSGPTLEQFLRHPPTV